MNNGTKDTYIIVRVEKNVKKKLVEMAGGVRKLSKLIREILEKEI